jgi:hypothetical protein
LLCAGTPQQQSLVQTLTKGAPGELTTIGTYDGVASVGIVGGDILVTATRITTSPALTFQLSTQVVDSAGTELQALTPDSVVQLADYQPEQLDNPVILSWHQTQTP